MNNKILSTLILSSVIVCNLPLISTYASSIKDNKSVSTETSFELQNENIVEVDSNDIESISKATGIPVEKISDVKIYRNADSKINDLKINNSTKTSASTMAYLGKLKVTYGPLESWGSSPISTTYASGGSGGSNFSKSYTKNISFSQTNSAGLSTKEVSVGLGFGSSTSYTETDTYTSTIPANKSGYLYVYPIYDSYKFDIYNVLGSYAGNGNALLPTGLGFITTW